MQQLQKCGKTKFGNIPEGWNLEQLKNISEKVSVGIATSTAKYFVEKGVPILRNQNINEGYIDTTDLMYITEEFSNLNSSKVLREGDVICVRTGNAGRSAVVSENMNGWQTFTTLIIRPLVNVIDSYYLSWFLNSISKTRIKSIQVGGIQQNLNVGWLSKVYIKVPPLKEQQKIASILSNIDKLIQKTDQIIEQTQRLKKGLMQRLLTKGIGHTKFKKTEIGEIPEEWNLDKLENLLNLCQYGLSLSLSEKGMYPIFRMNNIKNGYMITNDLKYIDLDQKIFEQYKLEKGDILINRTNSIDLVGKLGIFFFQGDYTFASYLIRMRTIKEKLDSFFLNFYLNTEKIQYKLKSLATPGVSQANINATNLKSLLVPIPSLIEQKRIVTIIFNVDDIIKKYTEEREILLNLKKGLMQQLLTGKIRVII